MKNIFLLLLSPLLFFSCEDLKKNESLKPVNEERVHMQKENVNPEYLYKIVSKEDWQKSQLQNKVVNSPIDTDFIHLATKEQLPQIAKKFWDNQEHLILKLNSKKLTGRLVYEINPGGTTQYYHLYNGTIPLDAVEEIIH